VSRVALLGTKPVMSTDYMKRRYADRFGIEVIAPEPAEQDEVDRVIFDELVSGRFTPESKAYYLALVDRLGDRGAGGVILGCTEIPLLIAQADRPAMPLFNTTALHVEAAVAMAFEGSRSRAAG